MYKLIIDLIQYKCVFMKMIIKFSPEITIKSRSVRVFFSKILTRNIKIILKKNNQSVTAICYWDYLTIKCKKNNYSLISTILMNIPGIHHFLLVEDHIICSLEDIYNQVIFMHCTQIIGKSFCIRVKRQGEHIYTSQEIEQYLGKKICDKIHDTHVNLVKPDKTICLEIKNNNLFIIIKRYEGLGGLPIGTQQESLSLISGGFDSVVASYMLIRRGSKVHYCFFNLTDTNIHIMEVYKIIYYLWNKFSSSHKVKIISINFSKIIREISSKIKSEYIGVVLKRMMIRVASEIANKWNIKALITGESLGQVSSQTLDNLVLINNTTLSGCIIFRPLIAYDKEKIITLARKIGTESFSKKVPEYCGMILKKSCIKAHALCIDLEENKCNISFLVNQVIEQACIINVERMPKFIMNQHLCEIDTKINLNITDVIIDIRTKYEQEQKLIQFPSDIKVKKIPFYQLIEQFPKLDQNKVYLLYCSNGIMSRLQAMHLYQQGFKNVKIYRFLS